MADMLEFDEAAANAIEAMYLTPDVVGQRSLFLEALGLRRGEHALDVGVGPGLLAFDMAKIVGAEGRVVGVDTADAMLAMARARCEGLAQTEFLRSDATALNLPDESFDAAASTQVLEYVAEIETALGELRRVMKPGGRIAILDTDWDSIVWHSSDRARMQRVLEAWDAHLADPHLPATLGPKMAAAGFDVVRQQIIPMFNPSFHANSYSAGILRAIKGFVVGTGAISRDEAQAWADDLYALGDEGKYFFSLNRYLFVATRRG